MLLAYAQQDSASLGNLAAAIYSIDRHDIILQIHDVFLKTCKSVLNKTYPIINGYIYPKVAPHCPFIFKDISTLYKTFGQKEGKRSHLKDFINQPGSVKEQFRIATYKTNYRKTILLTYSDDANVFVNNIIDTFRKTKDDKRLGVVVFNEQLGRFNIEPEQFIYECFLQVDYVIPIITENYIRTITCSTSEIDHMVQNIDNKFVKYIYALMNTAYLRNNCKNFKVRSVIPDNKIKTLQRHHIMGHSLFQIWFKLSDIEIVMDRILRGKL